MNKDSYRKVFYHIAFWLCYVVVNSVFHWAQSSKGYFFISDQIVKYSLGIIIFYFFLLILRLNLKRHQWIIRIILAVPIIGIYYSLKYFFYFELLPIISAYPKGSFEGTYFFLPGIWWIFHYMLYAWFYWYYSNTLRLQKQNYELVAQKLQLQYDYLQAQINPHFLYNTIGFFHSKAMEFSKETATGMELLSDIMRYSLQPSTGDGKVPLEDEVTHLHNYIELHQLRYENGLNIEFSQCGELDGKRIPPHVLITLVENAFKHGIFSHGNPPLKIDLRIDSSNLHFSVSNKINQSSKLVKEKGSGIGLNNIKMRLDKEYGEKFRLQYDIKNETFTVSLYIYAP